MADALTDLRARLAEWSDIRQAAHLLEWDQQTMMPPRGVVARAETLATLGRVSHEWFVDDATGRLLDAAARQLNGADPDSDDARLIAVVRRRWDKARRVPSELASEMARAASIGQVAWVEARARSDFDAFAPYLARNFELAQRYVEYLPEFDTPYDALLDDYEPGVRSAEVDRIFAELKAELFPLIAAVTEAGGVDNSILYGQFPVERQRALAAQVLRLMGFEHDRWRLDDAAHPFATSFGRDDVRLTTRWDETYFPAALYGAMHECGHGLYEAGISGALQRTPLGYAESLGLHESQSRMWENMVGRGRPFCSVLARLAGKQFGVDLDPDALFRAVNQVKPSYIRVEADEATYGLHVILRYELEQEMINGHLTVAELPEAWNARFAEYLGLEVADPADGVLQDVHWAGGSIGYFSTYVLGNLIAGHLWERVHADVPELNAQLEAGELSALREWLGEHVHRHGAKYSMPELLRRIADGPLSVTPFMGYLRAKLGQVYGLDLRG